MAQTLAQVLILAVCATTLWAVFCFLIPWMIRLAVLYQLHGIRDGVYRVAEDYPIARETIIYRDTEFLVTVAIHNVRERSLEECMAYAGIFLTRDERLFPAEARARAETRAQIYAKERSEFYADGPGAAALEALGPATKRAVLMVLMRVMFGRPLLMVMFTFLILLKLVQRVLSKKADAPSSLAARAVSGVALTTRHPPSVFRTAYRLDPSRLDGPEAFC